MTGKNPFPEKMASQCVRWAIRACEWHHVNVHDSTEKNYVIQRTRERMEHSRDPMQKSLTERGIMQEHERA
jgi:hypothetical protein